MNRGAGELWLSPVQALTLCTEPPASGPSSLIPTPSLPGAEFRGAWAQIWRVGPFGRKAMEGKEKAASLFSEHPLCPWGPLTLIRWPRALGQGHADPHWETHPPAKVADWWLASFQAESACQLPVLTTSLPAAQLQSGCKQQLPVRRVTEVQDSPERPLPYPLITGRKEVCRVKAAMLGEFACSWCLKETHSEALKIFLRGEGGVYSVFLLCRTRWVSEFPQVLFLSLLWVNKEGSSKQNSSVFLRNLYAGQEATVRTGHGTTDWFQIGKGVRQGWILSPCLFNFYAEYIMRNAGLEEAQAGIKIAGRNINNLRYAFDTAFMAESKELKSLLMKVKKESGKVGLKLNIQKTKIMASAITSWQIDGETVETVRDFIFMGSKITADGNCSHEIKKRLLLGRKVMTNLDSILKSRDITLSTKVHLVKAMDFPVVMFGCESWTIKKAEHWRVDASELWCWRRLLRVLWTARRSKQSILKEISPEYSLEGLMLKLKLQYFGHLMRRTDSLEKLWCWERLKAEGEGDDRGWMASPTQWTWVWVNSGSWRWSGRPGVLQSMGSQRVGHDWATELNWTELSVFLRIIYLERKASLFPLCITINLGEIFREKEL